MRAWLAASWIAVLGVAGTQAPARSEEIEVFETDEILVKERVLEPAEIYEDSAVENEVVTSEEIEARPAHNAADIVDDLTGMRASGRVQGEEASVSIEGMPPEYTRVLVNGMHYSGDIDEVDDLRDVPLENVERIEVLRGSHGVVHGPNAAGGVINVISRDPPLEGTRANLDVGGGDDGAVLGSGTVATGFGPLGVSLSAVHDQIDGYDAPEDEDSVLTAAGGEDSRRRSRDLYGTIFAPLRTDLELRTRLGWRREDEDFVPEDDGLDDSHRDTTRWLAAQEFTWFAREETRVTGSFDYFDALTDSSVGRSFDLAETESGLDLAVEHFLTTGPFAHMVTLGADVRRPDLDLHEGEIPEEITNPDFALEDVNESLYSGGIYLESETELSDTVSLVLGSRLEFNSEFDPDVLPGVALLWAPLEELKLRASWGRSYRTPSLRDLYQPPTPQLGGTYFLSGNPDLQPESSQSWRLGFEWNPRPWLALAGTGFWNDIDDAIRSTLLGDINIGDILIPGAAPSRPFPTSDLICRAQIVFGLPLTPECDPDLRAVTLPNNRPLYVKANLDQVRTRGLEARLLLRPHARLDLSFGYTLLDTEVIDSNVDLDQLPNSPKHVFDGRVTFRLPRVETQITAQARWRDRVITETSGTGLLGFGSGVYSEHSALLMDLRVVQPVTPELDVYLDLNNLTDERVVDSYAVRGRTWFVGVRARFESVTREGGA